jgi:hypothetical protein
MVMHAVFKDRATNDLTAEPIPAHILAAAKVNSSAVLRWLGSEHNFLGSKWNAANADTREEAVAIIKKAQSPKILPIKKSRQKIRARSFKIKGLS